MCLQRRWLQRSLAPTHSLPQEDENRGVGLVDGLDKSPQRLQAEDTKDTHASDDREGKIGWIGREGILQQAKRGIIRWNAARSKESKAADLYPDTTPDFEPQFHSISNEESEPKNVTHQCSTSSHPEVQVPKSTPLEALDGTSGRGMAASCEARVDSRYTGLPAQQLGLQSASEEWEERSETPSVIREPSPSLLMLRTLSLEHGGSHLAAEPVQLDVCMVGIDHQQMPAEEAPTLRTADSIGPYKSVLTMVIDKQDGTSGRERGKLDTASKADILSQNSLDRLGMKMQPYQGDNLVPLGRGELTIKPLGQITLNWHVLGRQKTYTTKFVVLDSETTKGFDVLFSENTINEIGFFMTDNTVWLLDAIEVGDL